MNVNIYRLLDVVLFFSNCSYWWFKFKITSLLLLVSILLWDLLDKQLRSELPCKCSLNNLKWTVYALKNNFPFGFLHTFICTYFRSNSVVRLRCRVLTHYYAAIKNQSFFVYWRHHLLEFFFLLEKVLFYLLVFHSLHRVA